MPQPYLLCFCRGWFPEACCNEFRLRRMIPTPRLKKMLVGSDATSSTFRVALFCGMSLVLMDAVGCERQQAATISPGLQKLCNDFKIEIVTADHPFPVSTFHGEIGGADATADEIRSYLRLLEEELSLYPPDFVHRTRLNKIVLCCQLSFAGQYRNAVPDFEHDTYYLEVRRGAHDTTYLRKVIHHDFFHIVDYRDDGLLYEDDRWKALNPDEFSYGTGGKNAQGNTETSVLTTKYPGFLNHYSTTGVEEDKAEVFANMIVSSAYVAERAAQDTVLEAKVVTMKELLTRFCPDLDDQFWKKVQNARRIE